MTRVLLSLSGHSSNCTLNNVFESLATILYCLWEKWHTILPPSQRGGDRCVASRFAHSFSICSYQNVSSRLTCSLPLYDQTMPTNQGISHITV